LIVLDEQLMVFNVYGLRQKIIKWYGGKVCYINDLRPKTVIKDDNISEILIHQSQPTFTTINKRDFWGKIEAHKNYCVVCFAIKDTRFREIPDTLKRLFRMEEFKTKALRMGKVIHISDQEIRFYKTNDKSIKHIKWH